MTEIALKSWSMLMVESPAPIPRDSHVAVAHGNSMYIFGGSTGSAMNDFHELNLGKSIRISVIEKIHFKII